VMQFRPDPQCGAQRDPPVERWSCVKSSHY
jgi:hypothetical protein